MNEPKEVKPFKEKSYDRNIRHICYSLLSQVSFAGEPVVPKIISEKDGEFMGKHFEVENLGGTDLTEYLLDKDQPEENKVKVVLHTVRQLKAIDEAGYAIFDRHGGNIRVLSSDPKHISIRQVDIEDMYDKKADCVYSLENASMSDELADLFKEKGVPIWAPAVDKLAIQGEIIGETHKDQSVVDIFNLCRWKPGQRGHDLQDLEEACLRALDFVQSG